MSGTFFGALRTFQIISIFNGCVYMCLRSGQASQAHFFFLCSPFSLFVNVKLFAVQYSTCLRSIYAIPSKNVGAAAAAVVTRQYSTQYKQTSTDDCREMIIKAFAKMGERVEILY